MPWLHLLILISCSFSAAHVSGTTAPRDPAMSPPAFSVKVSEEGLSLVGDARVDAGTVVRGDVLEAGVVVENVGRTTRCVIVSWSCARTHLRLAPGEHGLTTRRLDTSRHRGPVKLSLAVDLAPAGSCEDEAG